MAKLKCKIDGKEELIPITQVQGEDYVPLQEILKVLKDKDRIIKRYKEAIDSMIHATKEKQTQDNWDVLRNSKDPNVAELLKMFGMD